VITFAPGVFYRLTFLTFKPKKIEEKCIRSSISGEYFFGNSPRGTRYKVSFSDLVVNSVGCIQFFVWRINKLGKGLARFLIF
jgi:hypothetical protein